MPECPHCGAAVDKGSERCPKCHRELPVCPKCRQPIDAMDVVCPHCGEPLAGNI